MFRNTNDKILEIFIQTEGKKLNERVEVVKSKILEAVGKLISASI